MKKTIFGALLLSLMMNISAVTVNPDQAVNVVEKNADGVVRFAGLELQKYLQMITGKKIAIADKPVPGKYPFLFGAPAGVTLKPEEARWEVTKDFARLYGDSTPVGSSEIKLDRILNPASKSGDLTAVYDFLEKQFGMLFPAPGDENIFFTPAKRLSLKEGKGKWIPPFPYRLLRPDRNLRTADRRYGGKKAASAKTAGYVPQEFRPYRTILPADIFCIYRDVFCESCIYWFLYQDSYIQRPILFHLYPQLSSTYRNRAWS